MIGGKLNFIKEKSALSMKNSYKGLSSTYLTEAKLKEDGWNAYTPA